MARVIAYIRTINHGASKTRMHRGLFYDSLCSLLLSLPGLPRLEPPGRVGPLCGGFSRRASPFSAFWPLPICLVGSVSPPRSPLISLSVCSDMVCYTPMLDSNLPTSTHSNEHTKRIIGPPDRSTLPRAGRPALGGESRWCRARRSARPAPAGHRGRPTR